MCLCIGLPLCDFMHLLVFSLPTGHTWLCVGMGLCGCGMDFSVWPVWCLVFYARNCVCVCACVFMCACVLMCHVLCSYSGWSVDRVEQVVSL